jgi:UDP-N-acetyl-D-galactosamine dehydrogenase
MAVNHRQYQQLDEDYFKELMGGKGLLYDVKGVYRGKIKELNYLSL